MEIFYLYFSGEAASSSNRSSANKRFLIYFFIAYGCIMGMGGV